MKTDTIGVKHPSLLAAGGEVDMRYERGFTFSISAGRNLELPGGRLLVSGPKVSYLASGEKTVLGYKDDGQRVTKYYVDGEKVTQKNFFQVREAMGLAQSGFGDGIIPNIRSLRDRKAARFLTTPTEDAHLSVSTSDIEGKASTSVGETQEFEKVERIPADSPLWDGISEETRRLLNPRKFVTCKRTGEGYTIFEQERFKTKNIDKNSRFEAIEACLVEILYSVNDYNRPLLYKIAKFFLTEYDNLDPKPLISILKVINKENVGYYEKFFNLPEETHKLLWPCNLIPTMDAEENYMFLDQEIFKTSDADVGSYDKAEQASLAEILRNINDDNRPLLYKLAQFFSEDDVPSSYGKKVCAASLIQTLKLINKDNAPHYERLLSAPGMNRALFREKFLPDYILPTLADPVSFVVEDGVVKMDEGLQCCFNVYLSENNERVVLQASQNVEVMSIEKYMRDSLGVRVSFADNLELAKACEKILTTMVRSGHKVPPMILLARNTEESDELASCDVLKIVNPEHKHLSVVTLEANLSEAMIEQIAKKEPKLSGMKMSDGLWGMMIDYPITAEGLIKEDAADAYKAALEKDDETSAAIKADDLIYDEYDKDGTDFIQGIFSKLVIGVPVDARVVMVFQSMVNIRIDYLPEVV